MSLRPSTPCELSLLARGAVRLDGAIPPSDSDGLSRAAIDDAAGVLVARKLASWIKVVDRRLAWKRQQGQPIGLVITDLGRGILQAIEADVTDAGPAQSKIGQVITMLNAPEGVSLIEIMTTTGWKPHSARAALTGLRKKGLAISKQPIRKGLSPRYRIALEATR